MKYVNIVLIAAILLWDPVWSMLGVKQMFPWELKRLLRESPESVRLVDVRTPMEYGWFHIPGAQSRPELLQDASGLAPAPDKTTVIICMTGHRSPPLVKTLGQENTYNLTWGMLAWRLFGGKTE